jgi:hypothetical protein
VSDEEDCQRNKQPPAGSPLDPRHLVGPRPLSPFDGIAFVTLMPRPLLGTEETPGQFGPWY